MKTKFELAQVIDRFLDPDLRKQLTVHHQRTLGAIRRCRTAALGGHVDACTACGHLDISYNSCRNRNCPKCQGLQKEMWIIQREEELLPVSYFHVAFTLPHQINQLILRNQRYIYNLLFESAWYVLNKKTKSLHLAKLELLNKIHLALSRTERRAFAKVRLFGFKKKNCSCCGGKMIRINVWERNKSPPDYLGLRTE